MHVLPIGAAPPLTVPYSSLPKFTPAARSAAPDGRRRARRSPALAPGGFAMTMLLAGATSCGWGYPRIRRSPGGARPA